MPTGTKSRHSSTESPVHICELGKFVRWLKQKRSIQINSPLETIRQNNSTFEREKKKTHRKTLMYIRFYMHVCVYVCIYFIINGYLSGRADQWQVI